ncbi:MAG: hypothetical protein HKN18_08585 [Silicimonas sp.]|nr:hypothetical protein [Silicimonas sp.]
MRLTAIALTCAASLAHSEDWRPLKGDDIGAALTDRVLQYDGAWQDFRASGRTLYNAGRDSWGTWTVRGDQYCRQWPPSADWACYDVGLSADGHRIRFRGAGSDVTIGTFRD